MSNFNTILDQFRRLEAQVRVHMPHLTVEEKRQLSRASRNLERACHTPSDSSEMLVDQPSVMMKNGVAPEEAWYSDKRRNQKPIDTVPMLMSYHPSFNVIGTLTGRDEAGKIKDTPLEALRKLNEKLPQPTTLKAEQDCVIGGMTIKKGDELKINNLFAHQVEMLKELESLNKSTLIGRMPASLGKSEQMLPGLHWLDGMERYSQAVDARQAEDRVHRASPLIVEIAMPSDEALLKNLAAKKELHAKMWGELKDQLDEKERAASINVGKLSTETVKEIGAGIRREMRRHEVDAKAYAEMTLETLGESHEECDAPMIINQEKKDESR